MCAAASSGVRLAELVATIGQESLRRLIETAGEALRPFTVAGGGVELPIRGHLITAAKAA